MTASVSIPVPALGDNQPVRPSPASGAGAVPSVRDRVRGPRGQQGSGISDPLAGVADKPLDASAAGQLTNTPPEAPSEASVADATLALCLGRLDKRVAYALRQFTIPSLLLPAVPIVAQAIQDAQALGQGIIVTGPRGVGKTFALKHAVVQLEAAEEEALELNPENHPLARPLYFDRLSGASMRDCAHAFLSRLMPGAFTERTRGQRRSEDELLALVLTALHRQGYALILVDEGETLTDAGIEFLRRLLASGSVHTTTSAQACGRNVARDVGADSAPALAPRIRQSLGSAEARRDSIDCERTGPGVGLAVVIAGTRAIADRLSLTEDRNGRWAAFRDVPGLDAVTVGAIYRDVFPGFDDVIAVRGEPWWSDFVGEHIVRSRKLPVRQLVNHCRLYFSTLYNASLDATARSGSDGGDDPLITREQVVFDQALFLWSFSELDAGAARGTEAVARLVAQGRRSRRRRTE